MKKIFSGLAITTALATTCLAHAADVKPTVVLVHGAFADSSSWNGVVKILEKDGYPVIAAANPLRGVASDAQSVASIVKSVKTPVVLVGHSYGGAVISDAAYGSQNVKALVYVAAFTPEKGETAAELSGRFPGGTLASALAAPVDLADGGKDLYIQQDKFHDQFAADVSGRCRTSRMRIWSSRRWTWLTNSVAGLKGFCFTRIRARNMAAASFVNGSGVIACAKA